MSFADRICAKAPGSASDEEKMEASAVRILALRSHTRSELRKKLRGRKFPHDEIEALLERFTRSGYLDDTAAARNWARRRLRARSMGTRSMVQELRGIGASDEIIEETIAEAYGEEGEIEHARRAAGKRLKGLEGKDKLRERLLRFLMGRGFAPGVCFQVADEILGPKGL